MDDIEQRLAECFAAVLPDIKADEIKSVSAASKSWDSVTTITLVAVIEEEFGISIGDVDPARFDSFKSILNYLQQTAG